MRLLFALILGLALLIVPSSAHGQDLPRAPTRWVTDTAGTLSPEMVRRLDERLAAFEHSTGHQILVWTGRTTGGVPLEEWAARTFESWRVGRKGMDDGLALFVLTDDRAARIEVGYGLEERIPDVVASRILNDAVLPGMRAGDPDGAISQAVDRLLSALGGETSAPSEPMVWPFGPFQTALLGLALIVLIVFAVRHPALAYWLFVSLVSGRGQNGGGGFQFRGGGGRSGGGGASGRW